MIFRIIRMLVLAVSLTSAAAGAATPGVTVHPAKGGFDDVKERVVVAIENRGLVINYTAHVGDMLDRTGKDIGRSKRVYAKAEALEFCSAALSRESMEADPRNIAFCPYAIAIYTLPGDAAQVYVAYRTPLALGPGRSMRALRDVGRLLDDIVREALK